jgi:lysyl-tRNA synthetase class 2
MDENNSLLQEQDLNEILKIRRDKLKELKESGKNPFEQVKYNKTHSSEYIKENFDALEGSIVSVAGRMLSKRGMGKASFCDLADREGKIQLYVRQDGIGEESYAMFKKYDIGDIIGVEGEVFRTSKGEISVKAGEVVLLSKSLQPLPEKWHGLKDMDLKYRQRYVDLIINPDVRQTFITRSKIIKEIRAFLDNRGYLEVETPILNTIPGGAAARPFVTHHNTLDIDMYLRIATELHLKRLIVGGLEKVYEIGRIFRNEGMSIKHNPEFTSIELYEAYSDYHKMMDITEGMISTVTQNVLGTAKITYQDTEIDLGMGWERITMTEAVKKYAGIDFSQAKTAEEARETAKAHGIEGVEKLSKGEVIYKTFEDRVEDKLTGPVFIMDYPVEVSPLAKRKADDPEFTERFEFFIVGREMGNASILFLMFFTVFMR